MAVLKCNVCGGELEINEERTVGVCKYCGATITIPKNLDRMGNLYNRATFLRQNNEFDKAASVYEEILRENNDDVEAHWGLTLCKYGIEYVSDPHTGERMPTCHRTQTTSILSDPDYQKALELSDFDAKNVIESEAARISEIQTKILELARREPPYDIFICYKESDESGSRTEDSVLAQDLYYELTKKGYKVFYARKTLEKRLGTEYESIIFAALASASVMVVLGTKPEHFQSVWVKNEWNRFLKMSADSKKTIIPAYKNMSPYELPMELSALQSQDMSRIGFLQELLDGIDRCLRTGIHDSDSTAVETAGGQASATSFLEKLLQNGETLLKLNNLTDAGEVYKRVTSEYPEDYRGWWGLIVCSTQNLSKVSEQKKQVDVWYGYVKTLAPADALKELETRYVEYLKLVAWDDVRDAANKVDSLKKGFKDGLEKLLGESRQKEKKMEEERQRILKGKKEEVERHEAALAKSEKQSKQGIILAVVCLGVFLMLMAWVSSLFRAHPNVQMNGSNQSGMFLGIFGLLALVCITYLQHIRGKKAAGKDQELLGTARNAFDTAEAAFQKQYQSERESVQNSKEGYEQRIRECELYRELNPEVLQFFFYRIRCERIGVTVQAPGKMSIPSDAWEIFSKFNEK